MNAERWKRLNELFDQASALPPEQRDAYLDTACAGDPALKREVLELLASDAASHTLLDGVALDAVSVLHDTDRSGDLVGPYRLVELLGVGGMGAVYRAERADGQFEQQVALKLIKSGMDARHVVRRFEAERQILARLAHPNVARLLDGGLTDAGQPYFAMEYIDGLPIDDYCRAHHLSIDGRLRLFDQVCRAVLFAHTNLIVHRDLKPSNILVTPEGTVKLLDFGIAKVLADEGDTAPTTPLTVTGSRVMTPEYASPEQVRGDLVGTRSDVYSLGVVLYELLCGTRPYEIDGRQPLEAARIICDTEPPRPSTASVSSDAVAAGVSKDRLRRKLEGDLDVICLKALRKEPHRRYESVDALAEDLRRHLDGRPVEARGDSVPYRVGRFVRRHRAGTLAVAAFAVGLLAAASVYTFRLADERDRAQREAQKAERVVQFIEDVFQTTNPSPARGDTLTVRDAMDLGASRLDASLTEEPLVRARLSEVIAGVYRNVAAYESAKPLVAKAVELYRTHPEATRQDEARGLLALGEIEHYLEAYGAADSLYRASLALQSEEPATLETARALDLLSRSSITQGRLAEAESLLTVSVDIRRRLEGERSAASSESYQTIAFLNVRQNDLEGAVDAYRTAITLREAALGADHAEIPELYHGLSMALQQNGQLGEALETVDLGLQRVEQVAGSNNAMLAHMWTQRGSIAQDQRAWAVAKASYDSAYVNYLSAGLRGIASIVLNNLGTLYIDQDDHEGAIDAFGRAVAMAEEEYGTASRRYANPLCNLADVNSKSGQHAKALAQFDTCRAAYEQAVGPDHPRVLSSRVKHANAWKRAGRYAESIQAYESVIAIYQRAERPQVAWLAIAQEELGEAYLLSGQPTRGRAHMDQAVTTLRDAYGPDDERVLSAQKRRAETYES